MAYYVGKEICQGCGKPGTVVERWSKDSLCAKCKKEITLGRAKEVELQHNYTWLSQFYHALNSLEFNDNTLNHGLHDVLKSLDNKFAEHDSRISGYMKQYYDNSYSVTIPTELVKPIQELFLKLNERVKELKKEKESLRSFGQSEAFRCKNEIFQQGLEAGRNLLFQLNSGEITMEHFNIPNINFSAK
jgi:hypothetical protein